MTSESKQILDELKAELRRQASPWSDRSGACDYCGCCLSEIDKARAEGKIKTYWRNGTPMFKKHDEDEPGTLDHWIARGKNPATKKLQEAAV